MTTRISSQNISSSAFVDFPAQIGTGTPASGLQKIIAFLADRCLELRIAAKTIYRSFSFSAVQLHGHIEQIQTYKTTVENLNQTDEAKALYVSAEGAISAEARAHFVHDPNTFMVNNAVLSQERKNKIVHESSFLLSVLKVMLKIKEFFFGKVKTPQPLPSVKPPVAPTPSVRTTPDPIRPINPKPDEKPKDPLTPDAIFKALKYRPADPKMGQVDTPNVQEFDPSILSEPESIFLFELSANAYPAVFNREKQIEMMSKFIPGDESEETPSVAKFKEKYQCASTQDGVPMRMPSYHEGIDNEACQDLEIMKHQLSQKEDPFKPEEIRKKCAICNVKISDQTVKINLTLQREIASELEVFLSQLTDDQIIKRLKKLIREELAEEQTTTRSVSADPFATQEDIVVNRRQRTNEEILQGLGDIFRNLPEKMNGKQVRDNIIWLLYAHCSEI